MVRHTWRFTRGLAEPSDHMLRLFEQVAAVGLRVDQAETVKHLLGVLDLSVQHLGRPLLGEQ